MIALALAAMALAGPPGPGDLSEDRDEPTVVWIVEGARSMDTTSLYDRCEAEPLAHPELPAGLRAKAHVSHGRECDGSWVFLDLAVEVHGERRSKWAHTTFDAVSLEPPRRSPWSGVKTQGTLWVHPYGERPLLALPVDDPHWEHPLRLGYGEPVEVLDRDLGVVRTTTGREAVLQRGDFNLKEADPLLERTTPEDRALRRRLIAGRARHERDHPLAPVPPSAVLAKVKARGQPLEVHFDAHDLAGESFEADWLEPVRQVLRHPCDRPSERLDAEPEPCGTYVLDYRAFGAWWPEGYDNRVIALYTGTTRVDGEEVPVLRVVVKDPWGKRLRVSPEWDDQ